MTLTITALAALAVAVWALERTRRLESVVGSVDLAVSATRDRVGVTDNDVDDYHDRIHPDCAETDAR